MRHIARQPILNRQGRVHAYEVLFRGGSATTSPEDGDMAARTMFDNAVLFGLEQFTNGRPALVNCTVEVLTERLVDVLPPRSTILGIPSNLEMTPRLIAACHQLHARGFLLALDDFSWSATLEPLIKIADYVRVDLNRLGAVERQQLRRLNCDLVSIIAKKVETQEDYRQACAEDITLFQGDYFFHPVLLTKTKMPANTVSHFEIIQLLCHDPVDVRQVSRLVMRDAGLTYRLLRLVNSSVYAIHNELRSIDSAIIILGDETLRRIVSLAVLSELNAEQPPEILHVAFVRARFCELAARLCRLDPPEQYLLGMFSLVAAMLRVPMEELTRSLPLRDRICEALQGRRNLERSLLTWIEVHERGDWTASDIVVQSIGLTQEKLNLCYTDAIIWAQAALSSTVPAD